MLRADRKINITAEPIKIDKGVQNRLVLEMQKLDKHGGVKTLQGVVTEDNYEEVMSETIIELLYAWGKMELYVDDDSKPRDAHKMAKNFTKNILAGNQTGITQHQVDEMVKKMEDLQENARRIEAKE